MIVLSTTDLTLRFGTTSVLEKVSFSVDERDKLGIIGVNGSGKSSLFKLLTGGGLHYFFRYILKIKLDIWQTFQSSHNSSAFTRSR